MIIFDDGFNRHECEVDDTFEKKYPWDPDMPKGWQYREGVNKNGKRYRGYFPSPFEENFSPIWLPAYYPYGDPEALERQRKLRRERLEWDGMNRFHSGDPSSGDFLEGMYFDVPNMI